MKARPEARVRIAVSEARRRLPSLLRRLEHDPATVFEITVRGEPAAELRAASPEPRPGAAVRRLLALRRRLAKTAAKRRPGAVAGAVKDHLYGPRGVVR